MRRTHQADPLEERVQRRAPLRLRLRLRMALLPLGRGRGLLLLEGGAELRELVQEAAEAPEVALPRVAVPAQHLRGHVQRGAHLCVRGGVV